MSRAISVPWRIEQPLAVPEEDSFAWLSTSPPGSSAPSQSWLHGSDEHRQSVTTTAVHPPNHINLDEVSSKLSVEINPGRPPPPLEVMDQSPPVRRNSALTMLLQNYDATKCNVDETINRLTSQPDISPDPMTARVMEEWREVAKSVSNHNSAEDVSSFFFDHYHQTSTSQQSTTEHPSLSVPVNNHYTTNSHNQRSPGSDAAAIVEWTCFRDVPSATPSRTVSPPAWNQVNEQELEPEQTQMQTQRQMRMHREGYQPRPTTVADSPTGGPSGRVTAPHPQYDHNTPHSPSISRLNAFVHSLTHALSATLTHMLPPSRLSPASSAQPLPSHTVSPGVLPTPSHINCEEPGAVRQPIPVNGRHPTKTTAGAIA